MTCSKLQRGTNCSASGHSVLSTRMTRSPPCVAMYDVVVGMEAEVQRVRHEPADRRAHVRLEVLRVVPHERPDAVAVLEPELAQRDDELLRARDEVGVRVRVPALVGQAARDLVVAVELVRAAQDRGHVELVVHHQAVHAQPPWVIGHGCRAGAPDAASLLDQRRGDLGPEPRAGRAEALDAERALVQPVEPVLPGEADAAERLDRRLADDRRRSRPRTTSQPRPRSPPARRRSRRTTPPTARASGRARPACTRRRAGARPPGRRRSSSRTARATTRTRARPRARAGRRRTPRARAPSASEPRSPRGRRSRRAGGPALRRARRRACATRPSSRGSRARRLRARRCRRRRRSRRARPSRGRGRAGRTRASSSSRPPRPQRDPRQGAPEASARSSRSTARGRARVRAPRRERPPRGRRARRRRPPPRSRRPSSRARRAAPRSAPGSRRGTRAPAREAPPARV